jgi:hypothetical protein
LVTAPAESMRDDYSSVHRQRGRTDSVPDDARRTVSMRRARQTVEGVVHDRPPGDAADGDLQDARRRDRRLETFSRRRARLGSGLWFTRKHRILRARVRVTAAGPAVQPSAAVPQHVRGSCARGGQRIGLLEAGGGGAIVGEWRRRAA